MWVEEWLPAIKDVFQILFFAVVGIVAVLTYVKAKKSLLQPIKVEIFKEQLKVCSDVLGLFSGKEEHQLRDDFAFKGLFRANSCLLLDDYASLFFDAKIDESKAPYNKKNCPRSRVIDIEEFQKSIEVCDGHVVEDVNEKERKVDKPDPCTKAAIWSRHTVCIIELPRGFVEMEESLYKIMRSPLLPRKCRRLLDEYMGIVRKNIYTLGNILNENAQELPEKYPNIDLMKKASTDWLHHKYMGQFHTLREKANEITNFFSEYFGIERLLD